MSDREHGFPKVSCFEGGPGGIPPGRDVLGWPIILLMRAFGDQSI